MDDNRIIYPKADQVMARRCYNANLEVNIKKKLLGSSPKSPLDNNILLTELAIQDNH